MSISRHPSYVCPVVPIIHLAWLWFTVTLVGAQAHAAEPLCHADALREFEHTQREVAQTRQVLLKKYRKAKNNTERQAVLDEGERFIAKQFYTKIAPAWMGTPWTMAVINDGLKPDARAPHEKDKGVSCSWFVVSVLENLGLRIGNPSGFAGTIAIHLQRSLSPQKKDLRRFFHKTPAQLREQMIRWGNGLYIIGLNCHIGFLYVDGDNVTFIHSSYTAPYKVVMEPIEASDAIALSEAAGYVVSALFKDNRLIHHWLTGTRVYFNGPRK
ncbi:MAG: hypothetical protein JXX14_10425 [Deltaproteobacteria bacterium]|nr:hypothetical protein [Deltaproteobacteria bacterium]